MGAHFLMEDNKIYESYGVGMNIHSGAIDVIVQDNVVFNPWAPAIYPINSRQITIQSNLVCHTNDSRFLRHKNPPQGIMMGNEHYHIQEHAMTLEDVYVINNTIKG